MNYVIQFAFGIYGGTNYTISTREDERGAIPADAYATPELV